jgi:hypothetical protein
MSTPKAVKKYMSELGKLGGSVKSEAKRKANREKALKRWAAVKKKKVKSK